MEDTIRDEYFYTVQQLVEISGISRYMINKACDDGSLRHMVPPGTTRGKRIRGEWFHQWAEACATGGNR